MEGKTVSGIAFWGIVALFFCLPWLLTQGDPPPLHEGQLLLATNEIPDGPFVQSVVYVLRHDPGGAFGLVLNRPLSNGLYDGGPVDPSRMTVLHTSEVMTENSRRLPPPADFLAVIEGAGAAEAINKATGPHPRRHRVFSGYAGWAPGQLDVEIRRGHWIAAPYDEDAVFGNGADTLLQELIDIRDARESNLGP